MDEVGRYNFAYSGDGGLNQLYFGNGFKISDRLSVGVNLTYIFGRNTSSTLLYFPDSTLYANTKTENRLLANDFIFDYGILYSHPINERYTFRAGLKYGQKLNSAFPKNRLHAHFLAEWMEALSTFWIPFLIRLSVKAALHCRTLLAWGWFSSGMINGLLVWTPIGKTGKVLK